MSDNNEALVASIKLALRKAFNLGQTYWQQADSEYVSQHKKANATREKLEELITEAEEALSAAGSQSVADQLLRDAPSIGNCNTIGYPQWKKRVDMYLAAAPSSAGEKQG